jgi:hypothetical protein
MDKIPIKFGKIAEMSDSSDIIYWQSKTDAEKFAEAWRLVKLACELKGIKEDELRFQRSIASLQRKKS